MSGSLFELNVQEGKLHPAFKRIATHPGSEPTRKMMAQVYAQMPSPDRHFVQEIQGRGFDARVFELYLFAFLKSLGCEIEQPAGRPDFIARRDGVTIAVEATTSGSEAGIPSEGQMAKVPMPPADDEEVRRQVMHELPIRLGSPLYSKLRKEYWKLQNVAGLPLVFAIEAFHAPEALFYTSTALASYLFGLESEPTWDSDGRLSVHTTPIVAHSIAGKEIPSNFFGQEGAEHVSAVIFTNAGTTSKFTRMGYQAGFHRGNIHVLREGVRFNPDPNAGEPLRFAYDLRDPPITEEWGDEVVVIHNPRAIRPLPEEFCRGQAQMRLSDGRIVTDTPGDHVLLSRTQVFHLQGIAEPPMAGKTPGSISRAEFDGLMAGTPQVLNAVVHQLAWYSTANYGILGTILLDEIDKDFSYVVLGRDTTGVFRGIEIDVSIESSMGAQELLLERLRVLQEGGQLVFSQE